MNNNICYVRVYSYVYYDRMCFGTCSNGTRFFMQTLCTESTHDSILDEPLGNKR